MHFGIDLGTTNSLIAVFEDGQPRLIPNALGHVLTPSVVALLDRRLVVGETAREVALTDPARAAAVFKRGMGTNRIWKLGADSYSATELSALVLKALKEDAEAHLGVVVRDVVISVPAYFNELQRKAVRAAGTIAGLNVTRLINEPTAAALAHGLHQSEGEAKVLVFDLGGGTFDVSIVEFFEGVMEVRASAGDAFLGGEDFTEALLRYIAAQAVVDANDPPLRAALLRLAETAKRQLSSAPQATIRARLGDTDIDLTITRDRFDEITAQTIARLASPLDRALTDAALSPDQVDRLVLVGGATRMQSVRAYAARRLRQMPAAGFDPDHVVALGAAVQAALVAQDAALDDVVMTDVSAFTLGVNTVHRISNNLREGYFAPIIQRNSIVPVSREMVFATVEPGQREVRFGIYQGEAPLVANNLLLGEVTVTVPVNRKEHEQVKVRFTYDVSGLLEVEVTVLSTGHKVQLVISQLAGSMSPEAIAEALTKMSKIKTHPRDDARNIHLRVRIEACYAMARGDARDWVLHLMLQLDDAIERQDTPALTELRAELHHALDRFEADYVR
ncbi:Hsp70 family protein [Tabrizicola fusiformis]|uniref:Hsp70 family protein n=1 Tax=Tabrizicola sp. SY72 TaxID=2741673 RepID=UPI0015724F21|nr:Hsp70 family protein [Tabrizicola sp. SY72]NTT86106.1 Hsp70 family protein [Tabrizicola sp. SY72]